jgi:deoxyribodipyrimidine photo-lyase
MASHRPPPVCVWLKRDLRVSDHEPLARAAAVSNGGGVMAVFLYEPEVLSQPEWSTAHTAFQAECLRELEPVLARAGVRLITRRGEAVAALAALQQETGFRQLFAHEETGTGVTYARDRRVRAWAKAAGVALCELPQTGVVRRLASRNGWNRRWEERMTKRLLPPSATGPFPAELSRLTSCGVLGPRDLGQPADVTDRQPGGLVAAEATLSSFLTTRGRAYAGGISSPVSAATACSRLSPHLAFGSLSLRQVWQATEARREEAVLAAGLAASSRERAAARAWQRSLKNVQSRLHWHCHFMQKLEDEPAIEFHCMQRAAEGLRGEACPQRLTAWQAGQTGYPLIDACMRSVAATGWLTFRMRALVVSFASYSLWLPWRPTGLYLARQFLDFEPGIHWSQMQMQSGTTGINTLRIYNPTKQAIDQDPHGVFIRRWLPELAGVPTAYLHQPWTMPAEVQVRAGCRLGADYPEPIVDHAAALREAKARFAPLRRAPEARAEARRVATRHGSRRDRRGAMQQDPVRRQLRQKARPVPPDPQRLLPFAEADEGEPPSS